MRVALLILLLGCASTSSSEAHSEPTAAEVIELLRQEPSVLIQTEDGPRRQLPADLAEQQPHLIWNAFIKLIAVVDAQELNPRQRPAHFVFVYESEVQNGGHHQFFENSSGGHAQEIVQALTVLGLQCQAQVLQSAVAVWESRPRHPAETAEQFMHDAREGEFEDHDAAYHRCDPNTNQMLEKHLKTHQNLFVVLKPAA